MVTSGCDKILQYELVATNIEKYCMVVYDLVCDLHHQFEGWFKSAAEFGEQQNQGMLSCPFCHSNNIEKRPSAAYISTRKSLPKEGIAAKNTTELSKMITEFTQHIVANSEDVGAAFPEEAKKMHYGEIAGRNIRGVASVAEMKSLQKEGIKVLPLPEFADKKKLN